MEDSSLLRKDDSIRRKYGPELSDDDLSKAYDEVRMKYRKQKIFLPENKMEIIKDDDLSFKGRNSFYGISPKEALAEVERIKRKHNGLLTAEILLEESRHPKAVFHKCFTWDDERAADLFRIDQARNLLQKITVTLITDGESRQVRVYEVVKRSAGVGQYKSIDTLDSGDIEYIRMQCIKGLNQYRGKLSAYDKFRLSLKHIENAISELEAMAPSAQEVAA